MTESLQPTQPRQIRVYISSSFHDMQAERDILIKTVFPRLRQLCEERAVILTEVDLRWGMIDEEIAERKALPICLHEIDQCRPYFISMLGERYGWIPPTFPDNLLAEKPWLRDQYGKSLTELEILHGVLNDLQMVGFKHIYFRDPRFVESVPADQQHYFIDKDEENRFKLQKLKHRIRAASSAFSLRENYSSPEQFGDWVLSDFESLIDSLYPAESVPNPLDQEAALHEAYAENRRRVYIGRAELFTQLDGHACSDGNPLIVTGGTGHGKSALLAAWVAHWRELHPSDLIIQHYISSTPDSVDRQGLVRRIIGELSRSFAISDESLLRPESLKSAFSEFPVNFDYSRRIVLVIDAINLIADEGGARQLGWLPHSYPTNVRVIVSTTPGDTLDILRSRGWNELLVLPFSKADIRHMVEIYLGVYRRTLPDNLIDLIESAPAACVPLYLRTLLDELRLFDNIESITSIASDYLSARDLPELFDRIITRWHNDYDNNSDSPDLVRRSLCLIWAARGGLTEGELLDLLGSEGHPLPRSYWTPFFFAAHEALAFERYGIGFAHSHFLTAVEKKYLKTDQERTFPHKCLAHYYIGLGLPALSGNLKAIKWLPFHACEAEEDGIWLNAMTDFGFLQTIVEQVDVITGKDIDGKAIPCHLGYIIALDEIMRWLSKKLHVEEAKSLIRPLSVVWERHPEFIKSANLVMKSLYQDLKSMEPKQVFDRRTRTMVLQKEGPLLKWCERERQKYEDSSSPWLTSTPPEPTRSNSDYVFISYKREDLPRISTLMHKIVNWGFQIWYDRGIPGSAEWDALIEERVLHCKMLVVFLSQAAMDSKWVRREIKFADRKDLPILGIRMDNNLEFKDGLDITMQQYQMIDVSDADFSDVLRKAIEYVRIL